MAQNYTGLTPGIFPTTTRAAGGAPFALAEVIRGGGTVVVKNDSDRLLLDNRVLDNRMIIWHVADNEYQYYDATGLTRDANGALSGGSWQPLQLGADAGYGIDTEVVDGNLIFNIDTDKFLDTDALEAYVENQITQVTEIGNVSNVNERVDNPGGDIVGESKQHFLWDQTANEWTASREVIALDSVASVDSEVLVGSLAGVGGETLVCDFKDFIDISLDTDRDPSQQSFFTYDTDTRNIILNTDIGMRINVDMSGLSTLFKFSGSSANGIIRTILQYKQPNDSEFINLSEVTNGQANPSGVFDLVARLSDNTFQIDVQHGTRFRVIVTTVFVFGVLSADVYLNPGSTLAFSGSFGSAAAFSVTDVDRRPETNKSFMIYHTTTDTDLDSRWVTTRLIEDFDTADFLNTKVGDTDINFAVGHSGLIGQVANDPIELSAPVIFSIGNASCNTLFWRPELTAYEYIGAVDTEITFGVTGLGVHVNELLRYGNATSEAQLYFALQMSNDKGTSWSDIAKSNEVTFPDDNSGVSDTDYSFTSIADTGVTALNGSLIRLVFVARQSSYNANNRITVTGTIDSEITVVGKGIYHILTGGFASQEYVDSQITVTNTKIETADTALGARIDSEKLISDNADTALGVRIDSEAALLDAETAARIAADTALGVRIDSEKAEIRDHVGGEIFDFEQIGTWVWTGLNGQVGDTDTRMSYTVTADSDFFLDISRTMIGGVRVLSQSFTGEYIRINTNVIVRIDATPYLNNNVTRIKVKQHTGTLASITAPNAVTLADSGFTAIVGFNDADDGIDTSLLALNWTGANATDGNQQVTATIGAGVTIPFPVLAGKNYVDAKVDSEKVILGAAIATNGLRIDSEATLLDAETAARIAADTALGLRIDSEATLLDAETAARIAGDTALGVRIDSEVLVLNNKIDAQDHIDTKYTAAIGGGLILQDSEFRVDTDIIADTDYVKAYVAEHANVGHADSEGFGINIDQSDPTNTVFSVDSTVIATKTDLPDLTGDQYIDVVKLDTDVSITANTHELATVQYVNSKIANQNIVIHDTDKANSIASLVTVDSTSTYTWANQQANLTDSVNLLLNGGNVGFHSQAAFLNKGNLTFTQSSNLWTAVDRENVLGVNQTTTVLRYDGTEATTIYQTLAENASFIMRVNNTEAVDLPNIRVYLEFVVLAAHNNGDYLGGTTINSDYVNFNGISQGVSQNVEYTRVFQFPAIPQNSAHTTVNPGDFVFARTRIYVAHDLPVAEGALDFYFTNGTSITFDTPGLTSAASLTVDSDKTIVYANGTDLTTVIDSDGNIPRAVRDPYIDNWVLNRAYTLNELVVNSDKIWRSQENHTSTLINQPDSDSGTWHDITGVKRITTTNNSSELDTEVLDILDFQFSKKTLGDINLNFKVDVDKGLASKTYVDTLDGVSIQDLIQGQDYSAAYVYTADGDLSNKTYTGTDLQSYFETFEYNVAGDLILVTWYLGTSDTDTRHSRITYTYNTDGDLITKAIDID